MSVKNLGILINAIIEKANLSAEERVQLAVDIVTSRTSEILPEVVEVPRKQGKKPIERKPLGKPLVQKGTTCTCSACKNVAYTTIATVYAEGMTGEEFLAAFDPEPESPINLLTDEHGNECVDCPLCGGDKTVVLIRKGK